MEARLAHLRKIWGWGNSADCDAVTIAKMGGWEAVKLKLHNAQQELDQERERQKKVVALVANLQSTAAPSRPIHQSPAAPSRPTVGDTVQILATANTEDQAAHMIGKQYVIQND